jgi:hypothetical protein
MDEEEDDFYDPVDAVPTTQSLNHTQNAAPGQPQVVSKRTEIEGCAHGN